MTLTKAKTGRPAMCGGCGECDRCKKAAYMRRWYASKSPEERRRMRAGRNPDLVREQDRRKQAKRRAAGTPEQRQRIKARSAVRSLDREPCVVCGQAAHAHHDDYSKPLEVVWLCRPHHEQLHEWIGEF